MSPNPICYLDYNATTPVAPEVTEAMLPFFRDHWGNPSSVYLFGNRVGRHMEEARAKVAALIQADPGEIVFTSCGTESNNTAIFSALLSQPGKRHMVTTSVEHSANIKFCRSLEKRGYECTFLPVESDGSLDLHLLETSIRPDTAIVSVMWANNETGVIFPVEEVAALCRSKGVLCHTDAVQAAGKVPIDAHAIGVDMLSLSGHKIHAPKGVGMLYLKRRVPFHPYILGGQQEKGRRAGTENVPYIVAFGRAAELALEHLEDENTRIRRMRDRLEAGILKSIRATSGLGAREPRLPNTANISFDGVEAEAILMLLDQYGICASSGSACTTGSLDPSHVLTAMGLAPARARSCVRFSLGFYNTESDVDLLLEHLPAIISRLRSVAPASSPVPAEQVVPSS